jgi:hypothetical protein
LNCADPVEERHKQKIEEASLYEKYTKSEDFANQNETLVVGIDVAKETHYARAFDYRGIELAKLLKFSNTAEGFKLLDQWMQDICKQKGKTEIVAGFEPTGHYWFVLGDHLKHQGHKLAIVNPFHVNRDPKNWMITAQVKTTVKIVRPSLCWSKMDVTGKCTYLMTSIRN